MARNTTKAEREHMMERISATLPVPGGDYEISSAFVAPERRRFMGRWLVEEHDVDGKPWIECFAAANLGGAALVDGRYEASYDFREALCVKRVAVDGTVDLGGRPEAYSWKMTVAVSWEPGRGVIRVRPELGYQASSLGGAPAAVREFEARGDETHIVYHFEGDSLILEEGSDRKVLRRARA